jgi:hypothetical protein
MSWETPVYREINMSSEIGAYQDDLEERRPVPTDTQPAPVLPVVAEG